MRSWQPTINRSMPSMLRVGMIREALQKNGADKNTVIIYTSDNGFFCGSHGYGSKVLPYEESSRVR